MIFIFDKIRCSQILNRHCLLFLLLVNLGIVSPQAIPQRRRQAHPSEVGHKEEAGGLVDGIEGAAGDTDQGPQRQKVHKGLKSKIAVKVFVCLRNLHIFPSHQLEILDLGEDWRECPSHRGLGPVQQERDTGGTVKPTTITVHL